MAGLPDLDFILFGGHNITGLVRGLEDEIANDTDEADVAGGDLQTHHYAGTALSTVKVTGFYDADLSAFFEAVTEGVGYVGDFRKCVLWDREQASIRTSDSHANFFIQNLVAILAEMRAAFGIVQPNALVEIDLTA